MKSTPVWNTPVIPSHSPPKKFPIGAMTFSLIHETAVPNIDDIHSHAADRPLTMPFHTSTKKSPTADQSTRDAKKIIIPATRPASAQIRVPIGPATDPAPAPIAIIPPIAPPIAVVNPQIVPVSPTQSPGSKLLS